MKRVGLLAGLLVLVLGTEAVAQSPSPEPPPWFGGRVEMPEQGFAVALPVDWVGFDATTDAASQAEAASDVLGTPVVFAGGIPPSDMVAAVGAHGVQLAALHRTSLDHCLWMAIPAIAVPASEVADALYQDFVNDPNERDVEPPRRIDLPIGPAYQVRVIFHGDLPPAPVE